METQEQKAKRLNVRLDVVKLYDKLYEVCEEELKKIDHCKIRFDEELRRCVCTGSRVKNMCCSGCEHNNGSGCETRNLGCKAFLCGSGTKSHKLLAIGAFALSNNIVCYHHEDDCLKAFDIAITKNNLKDFTIKAKANAEIADLTSSFLGDKFGIKP